MAAKENANGDVLYGEGIEAHAAPGPTPALRLNLRSFGAQRSAS